MASWKDEIEWLDEKPNKMQVRQKSKEEVPTRRKRDSWRDEIKYDDSEEVINRGQVVDLEQPGLADRAMNVVRDAGLVLDYPGAAIRRGVSESIESGPIEGIKAAGQQLIDPINKLSLEEVAKAPSGEDIVKQLGMEDGWGSKIAGFVTESALDPGSIFGGVKLAKTVIKPALKSLASKQMAKQLSRSTSKSLFKQGVDPETIGITLAEMDLAKYANNPKKLLAKLEGSGGAERVVGGGLGYGKKIKKTGGLIQKEAEDVNRVLMDAGKSVSIDDVLETARKKIQEEVADIDNPLMQQEVAEDMMSRLESMFKVGQRKSAGKTTVNLHELNQIKRKWNSTINAPQIQKYAQADQKVAKDIEAIIRGSHAIDDVIKRKLSGVDVEWNGTMVDAARLYAAQNARLHSLLNVKSVLESTPLDQLKRTGLTEAIGASAAAAPVGLALGTVFNMPLYGLALSAGYPAVRGASRLGAKLAPGLTARAAGAAADAATKITPAALSVTKREVIDNFGLDSNAGREPQSLPNIPQELTELRIPRSTQAVTEQKDVVLAKIAQVAPELFEQAVTVLESRPESIGEIMSVLATQAPQHFTPDKYDRWDGAVRRDKIPIYAKDVKNDNSISNTEKINILDRLNRTGKADYTPNLE